ncbi:MAG: transglutaminase domain-containing protein [Clostridiales bacterium]|nr:transglutaminase domain-containing protein [Clostridiales bacterium]
MENKLDSMHSKGLVRSADTAVVRAITHEDIARHSRKTTAHSNKPAVRTGFSGKPAAKTASSKAKSAARAEETEEPREKSRVVAYSFYLLLAILTLALYIAIRYYDRETAKVKRFVLVEVGSPVSEEMFFNEQMDFPELEECNLDFSGVNVDVPQTIHFTITYFWTNMECELEIADTTPPTGTGIPQQIFAVEELPDVNKCVKDIKDRTEVTLKWGKIPNYKNGGEFKAEALLTDAVGNTASVMVPISVTKDSTPPVISGTKNYSGFVGSSIVYRDGVTVTDDYDKNPTLSIDTSGVDMSKPGKYKAIYTATDFSGNKTTAEIEVELLKKPKTYVEQETVDKAAQKILDKILKPGMTKMEQALQIVWWCRYNITYVNKGDSTSRNRAAYDAITKRRGNCYGYACAVREMLNLCGIENRFIKRYPYRYSIHYWNYINIDGEWYHCDSTPRKNYNSYFFMYTTKEIQNFHHSGWYGYTFKVEKYPPSATKSVQKKIDYANHKIKK